MMTLELKDSKGKAVEMWILKDRYEEGDEDLDCTGVIYPTSTDSVTDFEDIAATVREVYPMYRKEE